MLQGLKRFAAHGLLVRELRGLRLEVARLADAQVAQTALLTTWFQKHYPPMPVAPPEGPAVEVTYADTRQQQALMDIELRLTRATGQPPSEDEIVQEYDRLVADAQGLQP